MSATGAAAAQLHVTLVATPEAQVAPLSGLYETLTAFPLLGSFEGEVPTRPFDVELVAPGGGTLNAASGLTLGALRPLAEIERTDIAIVPLMLVEGPDWVTGRHPRVVEWLRAQHAAGAMLASACTGVLLLAETGLLAGRDATIHWAFAPTFRRNHPDVHLRTRETLVVAGERDELVMTGGVTSWHDLALHLIARHVGPIAAHAMARLLMLEWHGAGQAPFMNFTPNTEHDDAIVADLQRWLERAYDEQVTETWRLAFRVHSKHPPEPRLCARLTSSRHGRWRFVVRPPTPGRHSERFGTHPGCIASGAVRARGHE